MSKSASPLVNSVSRSACVRLLERVSSPISAVAAQGLYRGNSSSFSFLN